MTDPLLNAREPSLTDRISLLAEKSMKVFGPLCIFVGVITFAVAPFVTIFPDVLEPGVPRHRYVIAMAHVVAAAILALIVIVCLIVATCRDPGAVEAFLNSPSRRRRFPAITTEFLASLPPCPKCGLPKPARAHHCSVCGRCHLRMDHHCPAIGTCVALRNHRSFIVMLNWGAIGCFAHALLCIVEAIVIGSSDRVLPIVMAVSMAPLGGFLAWFSFSQIDRVAVNETTIEEMAGAATDYDRGREANLREVFGDSRWRFFWPGAPDHMSGFEWGNESL